MKDFIKGKKESEVEELTFTDKKLNKKAAEIAKLLSKLVYHGQKSH
ncbi:hypothetical protein HZA39_04100 [Candidatus Peregrinibacteria bacterium]|nr:hypothetical protein [Candidatus Peregrinibacteria bacterium]